LLSVAFGRGLFGSVTKFYDCVNLYIVYLSECFNFVLEKNI